MLRLLPTLGPMADARLLPLVMQGLQPVPEAAPTPGASKCSSPLIHVLVLEEKKRMVWDYTCSTEDTTVSCGLPPGHAAQCTGFGLGASWPLTGPARGNRRAESLPSLRLNLQAQNSVSSGRVQLPQPSPWGRLAGLHLPCSYVPEGSRRVFPSFNHPLQPPQTQCKPSSCGISAWGGESLLPHHAPWLPGQCHAAPLVCLPGSEAFHTLP